MKEEFKMEKTYALYSWCADDEGGYGVCLSEKFTPNLNYNPQSGWRARPSVLVGNFNTVEELADLLIADWPEYYDTKEFAIAEAQNMMKERKLL